jgi:hypothetical protein
METESDLGPLTLVTGGQTGIDRAMLDFCLDHGISCGGWCPAGRKAEDGVIPSRYPVKELSASSCNKRTAANVKESDATIIIFHREMIGGTLKSFEFVQKEKKPFLLLDLSVLDAEKAAVRLRKFIDRFEPQILNFSGPRESDWKEGYEYCYAILKLSFSKETPSGIRTG